MLSDTMAVLTRSYAAILFLQNPIIGLLFLGATLLYPNIGLAGLFAALIAYIVARAFDFPNYDKGVHVFNALLVGLSLGAFYQLNIYLFVLIAIGAALTVFITVALTSQLALKQQLPILSLPFIIVASVTALAAQHYTSLNNFLEAESFAFSWLSESGNVFFSSIGATFFTTHPIAGLILLAGIFWSSRYLGLLAVCGYLFGQMIFLLLTDNPHPSLLTWTGFNFVLTAMAIGGIYTIPSVVGFITALFAVGLCTLLIIAIQNLLFIYGLPVLALPFVVTTLTFLAALRSRVTLAQPWLAPAPALPEVNYERARLARVRNGEINSVPLLTPFYSQWNIYQGFNGPHTHKQPWQHALDFYITEDDKSYRDSGGNVCE